ncbi:MAG: hypothetical protein ACE14L_08760 [Terriglobales bacterium]
MQAADKKRILHGFGLALVLLSPMWIVVQEPRDFRTFGLSLAVGILLLVLASTIKLNK